MASSRYLRLLDGQQRHAAEKESGPSGVDPREVGAASSATIALLTAIKGLPLAYNRDMQETQEPLFEAVPQLALPEGGCRLYAAGKFNYDRMKSACESGFMNAWLQRRIGATRRAVPAAHEIVAKAVQNACSRIVNWSNCRWRNCANSVPLSSRVYEQLTVENVLACHDVPGGTAPHRVQQALKAAREKLATMQEAHGTHA